MQKIPVSHHPSYSFLLFLYTKAFIGQLGFLLRDKAPKTIQEAQEVATRIEYNLSSSRFEPFSTPRVIMDSKTYSTMMNLPQTLALAWKSYN
jgi:hypothetical protein